MYIYENHYYQDLSVIIRSTHSDEACAKAAGIIKKLCGVWFFTMTQYKERKSRKKETGNVFQREITIRQKGVPNDIIVFRESLTCIARNLNGETIIVIRDNAFAPAYSFVELSHDETLGLTE